MLVLLSPAKTLDFESDIPNLEVSTPAFLDEAEYLNEKLRKLSTRQLGKLMNISSGLSDLNYERNQGFSIPFNEENARPAIFAFKGDVYTGLSVEELDQKDILYAQKHLRILSGLYGLLRPLDLMQAYRLEMGTKMKVTQKKDNLYKFWDKKITKAINEVGEDLIINLASNEYFKAVKPKFLEGKVISPRFLDSKGGEYKMISFFAKKARGLMTRYIVQNRIEDIEDLKGFDLEGYTYNERLSEKMEPTFTREENW